MQVIAWADRLPTWNHSKIVEFRAIRKTTYEVFLAERDARRFLERLHFDELVPYCEVDQIAQRAQLQLVHNASAVGVDRSRANA